MKYIRVLSFLLVYVSIVAESARDKKRAHWVVDDWGCRTPDLGSGFCDIVNNCPFISELIKQARNSDAVKDILKKYACGVDHHENPKVCCPYKPSNFQKPSSDDDDHSRHKNLKLLPTKACGDVRAWGIFTGNVTNIFEFGWQVLLKYQKPGDPYICGGSLINKRYVLTAAHCIRNKYRLMSVRLGEYDVRTSTDCTEEYKGGNAFKMCAPSHQDIDVENTITHPQYTSETFNNDIGLIRLRKEADTTSETVTPICLPITSELKRHKDIKYTAIGWGSMQNGLSNPVLLKVLAPKVKNDACNHRYHVNLSDKQFCAGGVSKYDSCAGDGGGPIMGYYYNGDELTTILYGILSIRSSNCEQENFPAVYTKVASYVGWILDNIKP